MSEPKQPMDVEKLDSNMHIQERGDETLKWMSPMEQPFHLAGFPWLSQDGVYRRLPRSPRLPIRDEVDQLADCTAGGQIRFQTDSQTLSIRVRLSGVAGMNHMPATGQCGFDCYIDVDGVPHFYNTTRYDRSLQEYEFVLLEKADNSTLVERADQSTPENQGPAFRNITLNFPLYQGVEEVLIGFEPTATVNAPPPYASDKRIIVYGTSITQGGCASRPGMAYTNILSRRFPLEFINLGFSGNGQGEPEVAEIISDIPNPGLLVLDYEANCPSSEHLRQTLPEFIRIYRDRHPDVPIVVLSKIRYAREIFSAEALQGRLEKKQIQEDTVERLRQKGDVHLYFHDGSALLGDDFHECSVDGGHPTDLGFLRMANGLTPVLGQLLKEYGLL